MTPWSNTELRRTAATIPAGMPTTSANTIAHSRELDGRRKERANSLSDRLLRDHRLAEVAVQHAADVDPVLDEHRPVQTVLLEQRRVPRGIDAPLAGHGLDRVAGHDADQGEREQRHPDERRNDEAEPGEEKADHREAESGRLLKHSSPAVRPANAGEPGSGIEPRICRVPTERGVDARRRLGMIDWRTVCRRPARRRSRSAAARRSVGRAGPSKRACKIPSCTSAAGTPSSRRSAATCTCIPSWASRSTGPRRSSAIGSRALGIEHHAGIGKTGVVAVIRGRSDAQRPRASACAPTWTRCRCRRKTTFAHRSRYDGRMHGCGHDGHTTMLLAAARYLARDAQFRRHRVPHLPAGRGGLRRREGDDRRRPVRALSRPSGSSRCTTGRALPPGEIGITPGPAMAAADRIEITIDGRGGHGAHPHAAIDPVLVAGHIITAVQSIVSPQREPDRHGGRQPVRDAGRQSRRDERDPVAREARRHRAHVPAGDAGHDRAPARRARSGDRRRVRREGRRSSTSASTRRRSITTREAELRGRPSPKRWSAATTSCAISIRRWVRRISRSCCRRSPARSRGSDRAAPRAVASCTTARTISTTR